MLTLHGVESSVTHGKRFRIADSDISVHGIQEVLISWWTENGVRDATGLLHRAAKTWPGRGTPLVDELIMEAPYSLVMAMVKRDPTLHPRHSRIVSALIAEHGSKACMVTPRRIEFEAMEVARTILKVFSKYRDIQKDPVKKAALLRKCTVEQRNKLQQLLDQIAVVQEGVVDRSSVPHSSGVVRSRLELTNGDDGGAGGDLLCDIDNMASDFGGGAGSDLTFDIDNLASDFGHSIHGA